MALERSYDAVVVGSGPNGLAAAITLAQVGKSVVVFEARDTIGGGSRTKELTLPGFQHDVCSAIHPLGLASPFFRALPLEQYGLEWIQPPAALAHPLDDGTAMLLERSIAATGETLSCDAASYSRMMEPLVAHWQTLADTLLGPLRLQSFEHPFLLVPFGLQAIRSAESLAKQKFRGERARAIFAGMAAHSFLPLEHSLSAAFGIILALFGHSVGWPIPRGGSQSIVDALAAYLRSLGGEIVTGVEVESIEMLPDARAFLFDVTPRQLLRIAGQHLPDGYRHSLERYRYGAGVFKIDYALDGPIPWKAQDCLRAGTVHLGGTLAEVALSERQVGQGIPPEKPFVLVAQQSLFDETRAPQGKHTVWVYCHVPNGSTFDMTERIDAQIERFAPGFRDRILAKNTIAPAELERYNANDVGGDINGGVADLFQFFTRPAIRLNPYTTPNKRIYICSSSTPPSGGVHGMCGYYGAKAALHYAFS
jgi:phytoene dehydrogenase-like protein